MHIGLIGGIGVAATVVYYQHRWARTTVSTNWRRYRRYLAFVKRAGANPIARRVKIADLMDNLDVTRLEEIGEKDSRRISKYRRALRYLESLD